MVGRRHFVARTLRLARLTAILAALVGLTPTPVAPTQSSSIARHKVDCKA
jgi:hypothetical protein